MKDMFYKYDNCPDKKEYAEPICYEEPTRILESNPNLSLVVDVKGNELGLCARYLVPFDLFFMMDGCVENSSIEELILNSTVNFQILDHWHNVVLNKDIAANSCYIGDDIIEISITQAEAEKLKQETYHMTLSLYWPGGSYRLYSEDNGFLTIK